MIFVPNVSQMKTTLEQRIWKKKKKIKRCENEKKIREGNGCKIYKKRGVEKKSEKRRRVNNERKTGVLVFVRKRKDDEEGKTVKIGN